MKNHDAGLVGRRLNRRVAGILGGLLVVCGPARLAAAPARPPNVVVLFVDDLGWGDVRYRRDKLEWPNVDQLMRDGATFPNAYAAVPTCSPSRASVLTGQHPAKLGLVRHISGDPYGRNTEPFSVLPDDPARMPSRNWLPLEEVTYAEALKPLGYRTAFVGKWHLGHEPYHPIHQGFDEQFGVSNFGHPRNYYPPYFGAFSETYRDVPKNKYLTDQITDDAVACLEKQDGKQPFQLTVFYYAVHAPFRGRKDLLARFQAKGLAGPEAHHAAMCSAVDESVGRIRQTLTKKGLADQTVIFFAGDQGGPFPNDPLRGGKQGGTASYEGGARIPFAVCWPGAIKPGLVFEECVVTTDIFPTMLQMAGGNPAAYPQLDGLSLLPLLTRQRPSLGREVVIHYRSYEDQYAGVRAGNWKLVAYRSGKSELYDLGSDLSETRDLSRQHPEKVRELRAQLRAWESRMGVIMEGPISPAPARLPAKKKAAKKAD